MATLLRRDAPAGSGGPSLRALRAAAVERRWQIATGVVIVAALAVNAAWLHAHRPGQPFNIDEAGHLHTAWNYAHALTHGGLRPALHLYRQPTDVAPLGAIATVPFVLAAPHDPNAGLFVELPFLAMLLISTYAIARRVMSPGWACLAVAVTASIPNLVTLVRTDQYAVPAAAALAAALWAFLASDRFRRLGLSCLAGGVVGVMLLMRTMTLTFVPGFAVVAIVAVIMSPAEQRRRRLGHAAASAGCAAGVALTWYASSASAAFHYLSGRGYGSEGSSPLTMDFWSHRGRQVMLELQLPLAVLLVAGGAFATVLGVRRLARGHSLQWDGVALAIIVAAGYVGLSTSYNIGVGFEVPLFAPFVILCVAAASRVRWRLPRFAWAVGLVAAALLVTISKSDAVTALASIRTVRVPGIGSIAVWNGTDATLAGYAETTRAGRAAALRWRGTLHTVAVDLERLIARRGDVRKICTIGPAGLRGANIFNGNLLMMEAAFDDNFDLEVCFLPSLPVDPSVRDHRRVITAAGTPTIVVAGHGDSFGRPAATLATQQALQQLDYTEVDVVPLPDGGDATIWATPPWRQAQGGSNSPLNSVMAPADWSASAAGPPRYVDSAQFSCSQYSSQAMP